MKSKIKRHSRSVMSVILTISMLISTMMVGLIATDAARVGDEEVGSSDNTITDYFFKGSFDNWKKHYVNGSGDASIDISTAGTYEFVLVTGGGTQRCADKTFTKTEEYNTHEDSPNFKITVPSGKTGTYTFHTGFMSNNSVTVKVTFPSGGGTTNDWKLLDGTNNWSTSSTSKQFTLNSATGFYEYSQYFTGDNYFRIANGTTQYQGTTGNQDTDIAANADWTALKGNSNNAFKFSPSAAGTYIIQVDASNTQVKIIPAAKYTITRNTPTNGTLTSSAANAYAGDTVTLTATPEENYTLKSLILNYDDNDHDVTSSVEDNKYTFTMPAYNVTATATYTSARTIYFNNYETKWTKVFAYTKNSSGTEGNGASPGMEMTRVGTSSIYKVEVPSGMDTIIFTGSGGANNSGATITCNNQTIGNSLPGDTTYNEYKATKADATTGTWSKHVDRNNVYTVTPGTSVTDNNSLYYKGLKATLYDYYTDGEYNNGNPNWIGGIQNHTSGQSHDAEYSLPNGDEYKWNPYKTFNAALSQYASDKSITYPLYFGNLNVKDAGEGYLEYIARENSSVYKNWSYKINNSTMLSPGTSSITGLAADTESNSTITHSGGTVPMAMFDEDWLSKENSTGNPLATILNSTGFPVRKETAKLLYLDLSSSAANTWESGSAVMVANFHNTSSDTTSGKRVRMTSLGNHKYSVAVPSGYTQVEWLRMDPSEDLSATAWGHKDAGAFSTDNMYTVSNYGTNWGTDVTGSWSTDSTLTPNYTYYEYDSTNGKDNAYIQKVNTNAKTATIEYSETDKVYSSGILVDGTRTGSQAGFFPFDNMTNSSDTAINVNTGSSTQAKDLGFGMKLEIPFSLNENGTVDGTASGIAQTFNFSGDDDLWVYVDGHLVLDLGGAHNKSEGSINFKDRIATSTTKKVDAATAAASTDNNATLTATETYSNDFSSASWFDTNPETMHTMTLYYMERGMYDSNLRFDFSFHAVKNLYTTEKKIRTSGTEQVKINSGFYTHYQDANAGINTDYINGKMTKFEKSYQDEQFNFDHKVLSDGTTYAYPDKNLKYSNVHTSWSTTGESKTTTAKTYTYGTDQSLSYGLTNDDKEQFNGQFDTGTHFQITETAAQGNKYKYTPKLTVYDDTNSGREQYFNVQNVGAGAYTFAFDQNENLESQVVNVRALFENQMKQHTLTIKKNVTGQTTDGDFTFKVLFNFAYEDSGDNGYEPYPLYISSDKDTGKEKLGYDGSMTIKDGETITIKGIPEGADFKIIEQPTATNYDYGSISATGATPTTVSGQNAVTMTMGENDINATITNVYNVVNATIRIKYAPTYYDFTNNTNNINSDTYKKESNVYTNEGATTGCKTSFNAPSEGNLTITENEMVKSTTRSTSESFEVSVTDLNTKGKLFIGWYDENGNRYNDTSDLTHHSTTASATRAKDRVFEARFINAPTYRIDYTVPTRLWGNRVYKVFGNITNDMITDGSVGYDSSRTVTDTVDQRYYLAAKIVNDNKPKEEIFLENIKWETVSDEASATEYNKSKLVTKNTDQGVTDAETVTDTGNVTYNLYRSTSATAVPKEVTVDMYYDCSNLNTMTTSYTVRYGSSVNNNETEAISIPEGKTFYRWKIETLNSLGGTDDRTLVTYDYSKNFNYVAYDNYKVTAEIIDKQGGKDYNPYTAGKEGDPYSAVAPANTTSVINLGQTRSHWNDTSTGVKYTPGEGESTQRTNANCDYDRLFIDLALSYSNDEQKLNTLENLNVGFIIEYYNTTTQQWEEFKSVSFSSKELGDKNRIEYYYGFMNSPELREVDLQVTPTIGGVKSGNTLAFNFNDAKFS